MSDMIVRWDNDEQVSILIDGADQCHSGSGLSCHLQRQADYAEEMQERADG